MPTLEQIIISDFRNIRFCELHFSEGLNCICGENGQGKTNLLDAVYYLSMTKSAFASSDRFCIRHGCNSFAICGTYAMRDGVRSRVALTSSSDGTKVLKRDDKAVPRVSSHIGTLPVVMVSPQDYSLISDGGEERRRFMNAVLSQLDPEYLNQLQRYNRALAQRNHLLKDPRTDRQLLETIGVQMTPMAEYIVRSRMEFAEAIRHTVCDYYRLLSGGAEDVGIAYRSDLVEGPNCSVRPLDALLSDAMERDIALRFTSVGIQRDDLDFSMEGYPIRKCGSQGQQKSFLVALKLAQYDIMRKACGYPPILLLDDVFDKLDMNRTANLLKMVGDSGFGQIFITDTNRDRLESIVRDISQDAAYFNARGGEF